MKAVDLLKRNWDKDFNGPCLRAAFHDAGTYSALPESGFGKPAQCGGVNGSFKKEFEAGALDGFKSFPQQNGMQLCYDFLWGSNGDSGLRKQILAIPECTKMTNADLIQIAGYVAVVKGGGASCSFYPGRPDSNGYDNVSAVAIALFPPYSHAAICGIDADALLASCLTVFHRPMSCHRRP